jgi:hypothetical protein
VRPDYFAITGAKDQYDLVMPPVVAALALLLLLIAIAGAFYWQERHFVDAGVAIYGVEDAIVFVSERLSPTTRERITQNDVRRILEWEMRYLQEPGVRVDPTAPAIAGSTDGAAYAYAQAYATGHDYPPEAILEVLGLRNDYLEAIGVVGTAVGTGVDAAEQSSVPGHEREPS